MPHVLVIHPVFSNYAGGEFLCLNVCQALQEMGLTVTLASGPFDKAIVERLFSMGEVLSKCHHVEIPPFNPRVPRLRVLQRFQYKKKVWPMFEKNHAKLAFNTQSSPFFLRIPSYHFVYSVADLFSYPPDAAPPRSTSSAFGLYSPLLSAAQKLLWEKRFLSPTWLYAIGSMVLSDIRRAGYQNSSLMWPPCRVSFKPSFPKKRQVVQAARLVPDKGLELYCQIASGLRDIEFYIIGRTSPAMEREYPGYARRIVETLPENVKLVEASVKERSDLIEDSMVYLYTGHERGIVLTIPEALSAGCIPLSPPNTGATDVVQETKIGYVYRDLNMAQSIIKSILELPFTEKDLTDISRAARRFSPEMFRDQIKSVVSLN